MQAGLSEKQFHSRTANWNYGQQYRVERNETAAWIRTFCGSTATRTARSAGSQPKQKNGTIDQSKSGE